MQLRQHILRLSGIQTRLMPELVRRQRSGFWVCLSVILNRSSTGLSFKGFDWHAHLPQSFHLKSFAPSTNSDRLEIPE